MLRPALVLSCGLALLAGLSGCGPAVRAVRESRLGIVAPPPSEMARARAAWAYFSPAAPAEDARGAGFVSPTSLADDLAATYAARRLGLIDRASFDRRVTRLLTYLQSAELSDHVLPGRFNDLASGRLVDPPRGVADPGWSGVATGQLLIWLRVLATAEPRHAAAVAAVVSRWQLCRVIDAQGNLVRSMPGLSPVADNGTGFAGLAALGLQAWGIPARLPTAPDGDFAVDVEGLSFALPMGEQREPLLTVPAALTAMIFGWNGPSGPLTFERQQALALAEAQERRDAGGVLTARSSFRRAAVPYRVENAVLAGGFPWSVVGDGEARPELALVSVAAGFGLRALTPPGGYGERVVAALGATRMADGWLEGQYESSGAREPLQTAATNAMVLISVLHRQAGTLYRRNAVPTEACAPGALP